MAKGNRTFDKNDPIVRLGCTILYNKLLEGFEPAYHYTHSGMDEFIGRSAKDMAYSIEADAHFLPSDSDVGDLLIAFEYFVRGATREYMLMGIGKAEDKHINSASIAQGDIHSVGWPKAGLRELRRRIDSKEKCRMISIHNHPSGLLHDLLRLLCLTPPGPSSVDRDVATMMLFRAFSEKTVLPEFYLVEDGKFRRFRYPSWESIAKAVRMIFTALERA